MANVSIIGIDISKRSFQVHGATADGVPALRRKLTRAKVLEFLSSKPPCLVVMETCGGAHHWGREIQQLGHEVRLVAPICVESFAKRQKSDARDAAAIVEAARRPTMRFVAVKTKEARARPTVFRTRGLLVRQRTQTVNAVRGRLAELGLVAPRGATGELPPTVGHVGPIGSVSWRQMRVARRAFARPCRAWPCLSRYPDHARKKLTERLSERRLHRSDMC